MPNTPVNVNLALAELGSRPNHFLKRNPIRIAGDPAGNGNYSVADLMRPRAHRAPRRLLPRKSASSTGLDFRNTQAGLGAGVVPLSVHCVPMFPWAGAPVWTNIAPPLPGQQRFIVTGQLSGCSFVVEQLGGGNIRCAHARPTAALNGPALRAAIAGLGGNTVYGTGTEYNAATERVSIIGVANHTAATWDFYAQRCDPNDDYSITGVQNFA